MLLTIKQVIIPFIMRTCYRKEIFFVLALKVLGLFALWIFFFSHPVDHSLTRMQLVERFGLVKYSG